MVRSTTTALADYLRERHGGAPGIRVRLETIPLGVNTAKFRPATPEERLKHRKELGIADDEVMILFVGRLAAHGKAHPFPMFQGIDQAVRRTGKRVRLVLAGWAASDAVVREFQDGAARFGPNVQSSVVNGVDPKTRFVVWHAADIFTSLSDNIQETFGLVIIEAMASGLPVVATDWDGYRDLVVNGATGFLVPTAMVMGATSDTTSRFLMREIDYDRYLAECSQVVSVDIAAAAQAYARLISDEPLRRGMGAAGRQRVVDHFAWPHVIKAYEQLWASQDAERRTRVTHVRKGASQKSPAWYPAPECTFAGYPTFWFGDDHSVQAVEGAAELLKVLRTTPLTNYEQDRRCDDELVLQALLNAATTPCPINQLDVLLHSHGVGHGPGRATLAWMLKYGVLRVVAADEKNQATKTQVD
jgi:hypothetical protein